MQVVNRDGFPITSLDDWERLGKPAAPEHWKQGRSAYELAADWIEADAARDVADLLRVRPELADAVLVEGVAEKQTRFDEDHRGPRNHDLLVRGRVGSKPVVIGVEGKADETFDDPLWLYREKALKRSPATGALVRVDRLVRRWFGTSLERDRGQPPLICMGYQLFSALAGTLADAMLDDCEIAVVLVMEYRTDLTDDAEHAYNAQVLDDFLGRLLGPNATRLATADGWITGPVAITGDGVWSRPSTSVSFAKLTRDLRTRPSY